MWLILAESDILWNRATIFRRLCLPRHCDEGEQDGDDGLFVHCFTSPINFVVVLMIHFQIIYVPLHPKAIKCYGL